MEFNFELLHRHIIGDIEKDVDGNIKEQGKYFFQNEAYRLLKKIQTIHVKTEREKEPVSNSILAVTGERGSGKTSFLKTIEKELNNQKGYYSFPIIDPSSLHGDLNILEIVCTHIDIIIEEKHQKGDYSDTTFAEYRKIKSDLSKIILAADTHQKQSDNGLQRLSENRNKVQFDEDFTKLLTSFLQLINQDNQINTKKEKCILLIDDLDLVEDKVIYELTEHIRKYFNGQMIVILAYKEEQLNNVLLKDKIIKEKDLKDYTDQEELKDQCQKYTEKLIPYEHRISLKNHKDFYGMNMKKFFDEMIKSIVSEKLKKEKYLSDFFPENIVDEKDTLKQWFEKMTFYKSKVNIKAVDKLEQVDTAFANNLRGIIQWIETIYSMETLNQEKIDFGNNDEWEKLNRNVELVRTRVIRTTLDLLEKEQKQFFEMWLNTLAGAKLYQAYYYLGEKVSNKLDEHQNLDDMPDYRMVRSNNVSLADVIKMISIYKIFYPEDGCFIYTFKVLYSCELIEKYIKSQICIQDESEVLLQSYSGYIELLRRDVFPNTKEIFSTNIQGGKILNTFKISGSLIEKDTPIHEMIISSYSNNGSITRQLRAKNIRNFINLVPSNSINTYFGQDFFSNNNLILEKSEYMWHPLTLLSTEKYLLKSLSNRSYVLISLFDLDLLLENWRYNNGDLDIQEIINIINRELSGLISIKENRLEFGEKIITQEYNFFKTRLFSENVTKIDYIDESVNHILQKNIEIMRGIKDIVLKSPYKPELEKALNLLKDEFKDSEEKQIEISRLGEELASKTRIGTFNTVLIKDIVRLFSESKMYRLVLPNEKQPQ